MPLCFGASGSVRTSSSPYVADLAERAPDLLAGDHVVVAVAHRAGRAGDARSEPASGSEKPWHHTSSPRRIFGRCCGLLLGRALGDDRRARVEQADEVHADVRRPGPRGLLEEDQLLGSAAPRGRRTPWASSSRRSRRRRAAAASRCRSRGGRASRRERAAGGRLGQRRRRATRAARPGTPRRTLSSGGPSPPQVTDISRRGSPSGRRGRPGSGPRCRRHRRCPSRTTCAGRRVR